MHGVLFPTSSYLHFFIGANGLRAQVFDLTQKTFSAILTYYRPAMPFGNKKKCFGGSFQFGIVTNQKVSPPGKPEI